MTRQSWDYQDLNPIKHRGDREDYFVLYKDRGLAYDYKAKAAYNALMYLLVDAAEIGRAHV